MAGPLPPKPHKPISYHTSVFVRFANYLKLFWRLLIDRRVSFWLKLIPLAALVYMVSPLDWLIPVIDDLVIAWLGMWLFVELSPPEIADEHRKAIEDVLEGKWREPSDDQHIEEEDIIEGEFHEKH
jgi:uncharacterized membrane protein YkvA (DUF1232 family)